MFLTLSTMCKRYCLNNYVLVRGSYLYLLKLKFSPPNTQYKTHKYNCSQLEKGRNSSCQPICNVFLINSFEALFLPAARFLHVPLGHIGLYSQLGGC
jgi:hypothetical protein